MSAGNIIQSAHNRHEAHDQTAVVHRVRRDGRGGREEGEDEDDEEIDARCGIDDRPERLWDPPGPPDEIARAAGEVGVVRSAVVVRDGEVGEVLDGACGAAPEEEDAGDEVACVQAADGQGYDVVEGYGGADADETDE